MNKTYFRYTTHTGQRTWQAGKEKINTLTPDQINDIKQNRSWLPSTPRFDPEGIYITYFTTLGAQKYENNLLPLHKTYLGPITKNTINHSQLPGSIVYEDKYQILIAKRSK